MLENDKNFKEMLSSALKIIKECENSRVSIVQDEIGYALGYAGGSTVEKWCKGYLPPKAETQANLARILIKRACGRLNRDWLVNFLKAMQFPYPQNLCDELFPVKRIQGLADIPLADIPLPTTLTSDSKMPWRANPYFVGRDEELRFLAGAFQEGGSANMTEEQDSIRKTAVAIVGPGGIGKTQLAVEFCHRYGQFFRGGVFWISFSQSETIPTEIAQCGTVQHLALRPNFEDLSHSEQLKLVQRAWHEDTDRLIIFDDCKNIEDVMKWRPSYGRCRILITSQISHWDKSLNISELVLRPLDRSASVRLLMRDQVSLSSSTANDIADLLGDLPLAIHNASVYLERMKHDISGEEYAYQLQQLKGKDLLSHKSLSGLYGSYSPTGHEISVEQTFQVSYRLLNDRFAEGKLASTLLLHIAYFAPNITIPRPLLQSVLEVQDSQFLDALYNLRLLAFISENLDGSIVIHPLLGEFMKKMHHDQGDNVLNKVAKAVIAYAKSLEDNKEVVGVMTWKPQPHLFYMTTVFRERDEEPTVQLLYLWGSHLNEMAQYQEAHPFYDQALTLSLKMFGKTHILTAQVMMSYASYLLNIHEIDRAEEFLTNSLEVFLLSEVSHYTTEIGDIYTNLGMVYQIRGNWNHASLYYHKAMDMLEIYSNKERMRVAVALNNLSRNLLDAGEYDQALGYSIKARNIFFQVVGNEHPYTAIAMHNTGRVFKSMGKFSDALSNYLSALEIRERVLPDYHPHIAIGCNDIGSLLTSLEQFEDAMPYLKRAWMLYTKTLGEEHHHTMITLFNLAYLEIQLGRKDGGEHNAMVAIRFFKEKYGDSHYMTARLIGRLGKALVFIGEFEKAQPLLERIYAVQLAQPDTFSPDTAEILKNLALCYWHKHDIERSTSFLEKALELWKSFGIKDHPSVAEAFQGVGNILIAKGEILQAASFLKSAVEIFQATLGKEHKRTLTAQAALSSLVL